MTKYLRKTININRLLDAGFLQERNAFPVTPEMGTGTPIDKMVTFNDGFYMICVMKYNIHVFAFLHILKLNSFEIRCLQKECPIELGI